ncbi:MAG: type II toxin-antitoxin system HicA family toxin [Fimbriimonadaceae bacterium]|nr:type II toxin-antitoxin system HicA family toxin [Fimbriimonadaceae bacterium]
MSHLPRISGRDLRKALEKAGFALDRQRGSHMTLVRREPFAAVTIPDHRELDAGTLRAAIRGAGLTVEELKRLL